MNKKFYMTTAIAYASSKPHIGNTYEIIMADALARYRRLSGYDTYLCTGTDEHGQKIEEKAKDAGLAPQAFVDQTAGVIRGVWDSMNTTYDYFIRTTDQPHEQAVQKIFKRFYEQGDIYKSEYEGWYCTPCESFFTDTQAEGGICPDCGRPVQKDKEEAYFFKMSKYVDRLRKHIEDNPGFIEPESRKKEMVNNFIDAGLQDLCVTRTSFTWGIQVDFDPRHVIYVWLDALVNYITALGYDPDKSYEEQSEHFRHYWPADVHLIGKDILRFHTIYWPIFLMALDLPLPKKIFGHPWISVGSDKMSKSRGNVVYADKLAEIIGVDGVRHYVLAEMPYQQDGSLTYENVVTRYNTDLANNLGNLMNRTHAMTAKYFGGIVPEKGEVTALDADLIATAEKVKADFDRLMDTYHVADAIDTLFSLFRRANKYIDETTPWALAKEESQKSRLGSVLYNLLETLRYGAVMLECFLPATAQNILSQLGQEDRSLIFGALSSGKPLGVSAVLFARLDEKEAISKMEAMNAPAKKALPRPDDCLDEIGIEAFGAVELRCAKVLAAEPVPKAKKLLKLQLDLGYEERQVVSGIAKFYTPESLIGKKVTLVCNLKPAKLCGVDSFGMILASSDAEGKLRVLFLDDETPEGARIS